MQKGNDMNALDELFARLEHRSDGYAFVTDDLVKAAAVQLAALRTRAETAEADYAAAIKANNEVAHINADLIEALEEAKATLARIHIGGENMSVADYNAKYGGLK